MKLTQSTYFTPLNPPDVGGKFSPPPREGELEGVQQALIRSGWIVRQGEDYPRFVTCYVLES